MTAVTIVLIDDQLAVREGIRLLMRRFRSIKVVGETDNSVQALALIKRVKPRLVLLDPHLCSSDGTELLGRLKRNFPKIHILLFSRSWDEGHVIKTLRMGASGYVPKQCSSQELRAAIRAVLRGDTYVPASVSSSLVASLVNQGSVTAEDLSNSLTTRQREVLSLIADGYSTKEVATVLEIGTKTVETHRAHLMDRLGVHDLASLVKRAIKMGLAKP